MKRIFALLLAALMILPLCACSSSLPAEEAGTAENATAEEKKTEAKKEEKKEITYPDTFAVGYAIGDISGQCPLPIYDTTAEIHSRPLDADLHRHE